MGRSDDAISVLVDTIMQMVEEYLKDAKYDRTTIGTVTEVLGNNMYKVLIQGAEYVIQSKYTSHKKYEKVFVMIPQNNYSNMFILCGAEGIKFVELEKSIDELESKTIEAVDSVETEFNRAFSLLAKSMGAYTWVVDEAHDGWFAGHYMATVPQEEATLETPVWFFGTTGFAYYPNGIANAPSSGMTIDDTLFAKVVAAIDVVADRVSTGLLASQDGTSWFNLDTGEVNFKNMIRIERQPDNSYKLTINMSSTKTLEERLDEIEENVSYKLELVSENGLLFGHGNRSTVIRAIAFKGKQDVTDSLPKTAFVWTRKSKDSMADAIWNENHIGVGNVISVTDADVVDIATFTCDLYIE
jgi:hypothetical protein